MGDIRGSLLAKFVCSFLLLFLSSGFVIAQPQYFTSDKVGGSSVYPLNHSFTQVQWIYGPHYFTSTGNNSGTSAPYSKLSTIYFKTGDTADSLDSYTDFTIKLGQKRNIDTLWTNNAFDTSLQTIYHQSVKKIKAKSRTWISFELSDVFIYDPTKSLIVEISSSAGAGIEIQSISTNGRTEQFGVHDKSESEGFNQHVGNIGYDTEPWKSNDAGISKLVGPVLFCPGQHDISTQLVNHGKTAIDSVRVNWQLDRSTVKSFWYTNTIDTFGSAKGNSHIIKITTDTFTKGVAKSLVVWTDLPNNMIDSFSANDTLRTEIKASMSGTYTVGDSSSDFLTLAELSEELTHFGVCGSVHVDIQPSTYREQLILQNIKGTSSANTVTISGVQKDKCIIEHDATSGSDQQNVLLKAVSFLTIKNLTIQPKDKNYGIGIQLIHSNNNTIENCDIQLPFSNKNAKLIGIAGTGSAYNVEPKGLAGFNNNINHNTISGGGIGVKYSGFDTSRFAESVQITNNQISGFDIRGIDLQTTDKANVQLNKIIAKDTTSTGVYLDYCNSTVVQQNTITSVNTGIQFTNINRLKYTDSLPGIIANNIVQAVNFGSIGYNVNHLNYIHNSIQTNGGYTAAFEVIDSSKILNNIFHNKAAKNIFYANDSGGLNPSNELDYNLYYARFATSATNTIEYGKTKYRMVTDWFKADTNINRHSFNQLPGFISNTDLHVDSSGDIAGFDVQLTRDVDNDLRCNIRPTIGADQFIPGIVVDATKPAVICQSGCLKYYLPAPKGFSNASYGTDWRYDSISVKTTSGYSSSNFQVTNPGTTDGCIEFCPDSTEVDSVFTLFLIFRDNNGIHCFSTFTSYIQVGEKPDASFTVDKQDICLGDTILVATHANHSFNDTLLHLLDDGQKRVDPTFKYAYDTAGIYEIRKYTRANGCVDSSSKRITVGTTKDAKLVQGHPFKGMIRAGKLRDPDALCTEDTTYYQIFPPKTLGRYTYDSLWTVDWISLETINGTSIDDTLTIQPDSFNNFRIRVFPEEKLLGDTLILKARILSLINTVCDTTLIRYIILRKSPTVGIEHSAICLGETITFTDTSINSGVIERFWSFGDGSQSTLQQDTHTYADTGKYKLTLTVLNMNGCHGYFKEDISVKPRNTPHISWDDSCMRNNITLWDSSHKVTPVKTFTWFFGDTTGKGQQLTRRFYNFGLFDVTLVTQDTNNCSDTTQTVVGIYKHPTAGFNVNPACKYDSVIFTNTTTDTFETTYSWRLGDGNTSTAIHPVHVYGNVDSANIRLIAINKSCPDTVFKTVVFDTIPETSFAITPLSNYQIRCIPKDSVGLSFKWFFGDGDSSSEVSPNHIYPSIVKLYTITCVVRNSKGCMYEVTDTVTVGTGNAKSLLKSEISIYPNPFSSVIVVELSGLNTRTLDVRLVTLTGNVVTTNQDWDLQNGLVTLIPRKQQLPAGIYFVEVVTTDGLIREKLLSLQ